MARLADGVTLALISRGVNDPDLPIEERVRTRAFLRTHAVNLEASEPGELTEAQGRQMLKSLDDHIRSAREARDGAPAGGS